ncbi:hypothetical protein BU23DRAFT_323025 [Bimuria novae-zelandiae CBS 107.79]|uniref:Uncharacterized protein n=1 Tax=Bimuria novae-zelandiae CBS 107.79 TaxID=1447943 RepID=A0A6A5VVF7_9PLEO|nr:hypothetical protein BU23DRAFT_323025 [Bimuria novae-zelandiae CBS 107.79]
MCLCTQYDSPTCGHSWHSMTESCGYRRDLLNCPYRQTVNYLVAPAYSCPTCNGGFADGETLQMIQGPWGCNQLIRNHYGGDFAVGNTWAGSMHVPHLCGSMRGGGYYGGDTRATGPYGAGGPAVSYGSPAISYGSAVPVSNQRLICNEPCVDTCCDDYCYDGYDSGRRRRYYDDYGYKGGKRYRKHDYKYKYRRSTSDGPCSVM